MSRYIMIRRLRGPAFLLLVGVLALLNQADILTWGQSWPFFLILEQYAVVLPRTWFSSYCSRYSRVDPLAEGAVDVGGQRREIGVGEYWPWKPRM